jgi:formylglycine-generating enzyme
MTPRGYPLAALVALGCSGAVERPQLLVHVDTDAPVPPALGEPPEGDRQPALVDSLRLEILGCEGCVRVFSIDEGLFTRKEVSFGIVDEGAALLRATLFAARTLDETDEPSTSAAVDVAVELLPAREGLVHQLVKLEMDRWGSPAAMAAPDAAAGGAPKTSGVGTWPGAARTPCAAAPRPDTGLDDAEVCVAGGAYVMGNPKVVGVGDDADRLRLVTLPPFFLDVHEYTVRRFRDAVARGFQPPAPVLGHDTNPATQDFYCTFHAKPGTEQQERYPLTCVPWTAAEALCAFDGKRLPTEAEWEFEASGRGEAREFPWGNGLADCSMAIFARAGAGVFALNGYKCVDAGYPVGHAPVGSAPGDRSTSGAIGMAAGAGEWVADRWNRQDEPCWSATTPYLDPLCDAPSIDGDRRSVRGAAWTMTDLRVARRYQVPPDARDPTIGFRCARDAP